MSEHPALQTILARRSIRQYTAEPVSAAQLEKILEAGFAAPSAKNYRPWHFISVTQRATLQQLAAAHPYGKMLAQATAAVVVCGVPAAAAGEKEFWLLDGAAATQNMLLAATALGLGSVWLGVYARPEREKAVREILAIPPEIGVLSIVALGHPAEAKEAHRGCEREKLHREKW